jgi:hypothetical protein
MAITIAVNKTVEEAARVLAAPGASVCCDGPGAVTFPDELPAGDAPGLVLFVAKVLACVHRRAETAWRALCTSPSPLLDPSLVTFVHLREHSTLSLSLLHDFAAAGAEALINFMMSPDVKGAA